MNAAPTMPERRQSNLSIFSFVQGDSKGICKGDNVAVEARKGIEKQRKTRYDKGSVKATDRDVLLLTWIAEQYAARVNQVGDLMCLHPGPGAHPDGISESAVYQVVARWRKAGWVDYQQMLAGEPAWVWLTRAGLAAYGLTQFKASPPAISRLRHIYAVNDVRVDIQGEEDTWISERMIRAGMYQLPQTEEETRHIPDAILQTDKGEIVIEVELTQKKPDELYKKMYALIHAWDQERSHYRYAGICYYTPDPRIAKALEIAREAHATGISERRVHLVQIELIEL